MNLKEILSVSGTSGLFQYISQSRNGIIVQNLENETRTHISSTTKVSSLGDIAIYTSEEEIPLYRVFKSIQQIIAAGTPICSPKASSEEIKTFFAKVLPDYDREKVYVSDIKKVIIWYNQLEKNNLLNLVDEAIELEEKEAQQQNEAPAQE
jgi:hypothetical protein